MINLLSPEERKQIKAARANSILMRYVVMSLIVVVIIVVELISSYFMLVFNQSASRETINDNQSKSSAFSSVKSDAEKYRSNLRVAKYILDTQTHVSSYAQAIEVKNSLQETSINKVKVFDSVSLSNATHEIGDNTFQANYTVIYSKKVLP